MSNDAKIVCIPGALDTQLDGRDLTSLKNCNGRVPGVNAPPPFSVWVDNVGGPLRWADYQLNKHLTVLGHCGRNGRSSYWRCSRSIGIQTTPIIASVEPRQVQAGELLTIYGQTCFGDEFKYEEGQSLKGEFSMSGEETRNRIGLKDDIIRIRVGKYICETMNAEGRYYRSGKTNKKWYCSSFSAGFNADCHKTLSRGATQ